MNHNAKANTVIKGIRLSVIVALLALLTSLLAVTQPALATTYVVLNSDDSGTGSLRQAITDAKDSDGPDIITFSDKTNGNPIVLLGAPGDDSNVSGDLDIKDDYDLTIQGNGAANTIIDGDANDRVFHICPGGGCTNTVTLSGVTIQNGTSFGYGGGIYNQAGTTKVTDCIISANTAQEGGGIYNEGLATVASSTVRDNTADDYGGGIFNDDTLTIGKGSIIGSGNTAGDNGGGIYNAGSATVVGSTVSDNAATNHGGGIYNYDQAMLNIQKGSTIGGKGTGNTAISGGGIYNEADNTTVSGSTISYNTATSDGGGIYNQIGVTTVDSSTVSSNQADFGGGIYSEAALTVQNGSTIGGPGAGNTAAISGGGIYIETGTTTVDASTVSANEAVSEGGGIWSQGELIVKNGSTISGNGTSNATDAFGGGIYVYDGTTTVDASTVSANEAGSGGGIYNYLGTTTVKGSNISDNNAVYSGAGLHNRFGTLLVQQGSVVSSNTAGVHGGGIYNSVGATTVDDSDIRDNMATKEGGGIRIGEGTLTVTNSLILNNMAATDGGGIYNLYGTTTVTGSRILNNTAAIEGGGVINKENTAGATSVTDSCIVGNSDNSFYNSRDAAQIATGNWWGAVGGPTAPGADTVGGNVDFGGFLPAPILDCGPELQVGKVNDTSGNGEVGAPFNWTLIISSTGVFSATFAAGQTILVDDLPVGPTYGVPVAGSFVDVANHEEILCSLAENTITCEAGSADVTLGATTGSFEVTIPVTPDNPATLINPKAGGICKVDPGGNVPENDDTNNDCPENVVTVSAPDLQVGKANDTSGNGEAGTPFHWTLTISNTGPASATFESGDTILKDDLPTGPKYGDPVIGTVVNVTNGDKIQCGLADSTLTCTATGGDVTFDGVDSFFDVTFSTTPDAPGTLVNPDTGGICKVDPGGKVTEDDENNNDCPENVVTVTAPDLQVGKVNNTGGNGTVGTPFDWTLTVSNTGPTSATFESGDTILKDDLPTGPTYGTPVIGRLVNVTNGDKIHCGLVGDTITCTATGGDVTFGGVDSFFDVTFSITPDAPGTLVNPAAGGICKVDPGGKVTEDDESNNDCPKNEVTVLDSKSNLYLPVVLK